MPALRTPVKTPRGPARYVRCRAVAAKLPGLVVDDLTGG